MTFHLFSDQLLYSELLVTGTPAPPPSLRFPWPFSAGKYKLHGKVDFDKLICSPDMGTHWDLLGMDVDSGLVGG